MYVYSRLYGLTKPSEPEEKIYSDSAEYGICCKIQDLQTVLHGLNNYLKKTKIRSQGLFPRFGHSKVSSFTQERCWTEWMMDAAAGPRAQKSAKQGRYWYFELRPNRHFHIDADGNAKEVWFFPDRKDIAYTFHLSKQVWYYIQNGEIIPTDSIEERQKRELFFQNLFDSIGFPVETLYIYAPEEEVNGCPLFRTWEVQNGKWVPYHSKK